VIVHRLGMPTIIQLLRQNSPRERDSSHRMRTQFLKKSRCPGD
jgi:hypothetical protein